MNDQTVSADVVAESPQEGDLAGFRPRLRQDVIFAESDDGVYLQRPGDQFVLKGRSTYRWMAALASKLNGDHTVEQLSSGLSSGHQETLINLINLLRDRGYVQDQRLADSAPISPEVRAAFGKQIDYVANFAHPSEAKFNDFRESRILVMGAAGLVTPTAMGLLRNGAGHVDTGGPGTGSTGFETLAREAEKLRAGGCACTVRERPQPSADDLAEYDLIIGAGTDVRELLRVNEIARTTGPTLLPLVILGDRAVAGPLVRAGSTPCWQCALLRQSSVRTPAESVDLWRAAALGGQLAAERCPPHLARMVGTMLAFDAFRLRTGVFAPETHRSVIVQDLNTAESTREPLLAHPLCPVCAQDRELRRAPDGALLGENGGILAGYDDAALSQSPVRTGRVLLPSATGPRTALREITAFDLDTLHDARDRAVRIAATCYAEEIAGRGQAAEPADPDEYVPSKRLSIRSGFPASIEGEWVRGWSMVDGRPCSLPVAAAYPQSGRNHALTVERTSAGAACGSSVEEAAAAGLLTALAFAGLRAAVRGDEVAVELECDGDTPDLRFLLNVADENLRVFALPGSAPAFACVAVAGSGRPLWALGTGYTQSDAMHTALRDVVGVLGLAENGTVDTGNALLPDLDLRDLAVAAPSGPPREPTTHSEIVDALRHQGNDAFVVETTPPDLRSVGLVTVRVLLSDQESR